MGESLTSDDVNDLLHGILQVVTSPPVTGKGTTDSAGVRNQFDDIQVRVEESESTAVITIKNLSKNETSDVSPGGVFKEVNSSQNRSGTGPMPPVSAHRSASSDTSQYVKKEKTDFGQDKQQNHGEHLDRKPEKIDNLSSILSVKDEVCHSNGETSDHCEPVVQSTQKRPRSEDTSHDGDEARGKLPKLSKAALKTENIHDIQATIEEGEEPEAGEFQVSNAFYCPRCGMVFTAIAEMKAHLRSHKEKTYVCYLCQKPFGSSSNLKRHVRETHEKLRSKTCPTCNKHFFNKASLVTHQRKMHQGETNAVAPRCDYCDKEFTRQCDLYRHLQKTHEDDTTEEERDTIDSWAAKLQHFICETCGKELASRGSLYHHQLTHTKERRFPCSQCDWAATTKANLERHIRTHTDERPYQCRLCNWAFRDHSALTQHNRIHSGEKPHKCEQCGKCFTQQTSLKSHMVCHTKQRDYKCDACSATFLRQSHLWFHKLKHETEPEYKCDQDGAAFYSKGELARHQRSHTNEGLHKCDKCDKKYKQLSSLRYHELSHQAPPPEKGPVKLSLQETTTSDIVLSSGLPGDEIAETELPGDIIPLHDSLVQINTEAQGPQAITLGILKTVHTEEGVRYVLVTQSDLEGGGIVGDRLNDLPAPLVTTKSIAGIDSQMAQPMASEEDDGDVLKYINKSSSVPAVTNTGQDKADEKLISVNSPITSSTVVSSEQDTNLSFFTVPMACGVLPSSSFSVASGQLSDQPMLVATQAPVKLLATPLCTEELDSVLGTGNVPQPFDTPPPKFSQDNLSFPVTMGASTSPNPQPLDPSPSAIALSLAVTNTPIFHNTILHTNSQVTQERESAPNPLEHSTEVKQVIDGLSHRKFLVTKPSVVIPSTVTLGSVSDSGVGVSLQQFLSDISIVPHDLVNEDIPKTHSLLNTVDKVLSVSDTVSSSRDVHDPIIHGVAVELNQETAMDLVKSGSVTCPQGLLNDGIINVQSPSSD